jgi:hypothetical protein
MHLLRASGAFVRRDVEPIHDGARDDLVFLGDGVDGPGGERRRHGESILT